MVNKLILGIVILTLINFGSFSPNSENCGISKKVTRHARVAGGRKIQPGEWPWLIAIFPDSKNTSNIDSRYFCVGNLISNKHILTAGHCVTKYTGKLKTNQMFASIGRHFLDDPDNESEAITREIIEIKVHPKYHRIGLEVIESDLAVLIMNETVEFTPKIRPICLRKNNKDISEILGIEGLVAGWGKQYGYFHRDEPHVATETIVSLEECLLRNVYYRYTTSFRTFCAGKRDRRGACVGDVGTGFVLQDPDSGLYFLRGLLSVAPKNWGTYDMCGQLEYSVYVDIYKYYEWLTTLIENNI